MILSESDAAYAADQFIDYFSNMGRIDEYLRNVKLDRMSKMPTYLPGCGPEEDMFDAFDIHPKDMNFKVYAAGKNDSFTNEYFNERLQITTSHSIESSIPGKSLKWIVMETNTKKIVGFIRFGSPLINSKPRNDFLGGTPDLDIFNKRAIMGFNIVPVQPFGYNYLGGKLLAGICCSHDSRRMLNEKYDTEFCLFETTSLYGNIKGASMYDGMRPFLRYKGDTQSKFLLTLGEEIYFELRDWFEERNGGEPLIHKGASSRKLKYQTKMVSILKQNLKEYNPEAYQIFCNKMDEASGVTTQKRFYMSTYGYENARDVLLGKTNILTKAENYDRFELENVTKWWKKLATKRYIKMIREDKVRRELEVWNKDTMNKIDIIR